MILYTGLDARNIIYLYGGRGLNSSSQEIFLDLDGQLRTLRFTHTLEASHWDQTQADLFKLNGLGSSSIQTEHSPPLGRFAHCSTIISTVTGAIVHDLDTLALREHRRINYLVFGGKKQINENVPTLMNGETENWEVTDELYVCAEYEIGLADDNHIRYHWYRVSPSSPQAVWPSARYDAQMIPLFNEDTEITDGEYPFLIFGGRDASNNMLQDAYIGVFKRVTVPAEVTENEWTFDMGITVEFTAIGGTSGHTNFKVFGAGVVYDPYYGHGGIYSLTRQGEHGDIEVTTSRKISISLLSVSIFLTGCATSPKPFRSQTMITSELPQPIWNSHLILWPDDSEEYAVWRTDPRFEGRFAANYPDDVPEAVNSKELFAAHFIVARCLAECYETKSAIEHFKSAIAVDTEDVHAHMGLMAELSVMVHWPADQPEPEDQLVWDKAFLDQMIVIKTRFKHNLSAQAGIRIIMDESRAGDLSDLNEDQLARRRRFGFGIIRWKMR